MVKKKKIEVNIACEEKNKRFVKTAILTDQK